MKNHIYFLLVFNLLTSGLAFGKQSESDDAGSHEQADSSLTNRFIWIVYDQIYGASQLDDALSYRPDVIFRGWFKWGNPGPGYGGKSWIPRQADSQGALFGGGGTCSALYPDETDSASFQRIVSRNPDNEPEYFGHSPSSGMYHGDIQNTEYLDFVLAWAYDQIHAGAQSIFLDEPDGGASWYTGYGDKGIEAFRLFLIDKYVNGKKWSAADPRWQSRFGIDLNMDCSDGTMNTFNYRNYLKRKNLTENPYWDGNLLKHEWGDPWKTADTTYLAQRKRRAWQYLTAAVGAYCKTDNKTVAIADLDYLIDTHWDTWTVMDGRLDISNSYVQHWRDRIDWGFRNLGEKSPARPFS